MSSRIGVIDGRTWLWILGIAVVPGIVAVLQLGRVHPDEIYQVLEPAYANAFGYGALSWEWEVGLRNWAIPGMFSGLLRLSAALGITHPQGYRAVLELPQVLLHAASMAAVHVYVARRVERRLCGWAVLAIGLYGPVITFAGRTLSESFSTAFLVMACASTDGGPADASGPDRPLAAGVMLGLAVVARYASAVFVVATLVWLLVARRWGAFARVVAGGAIVAALLAALDWATWGRPLHSLLEYLDFNLLSGKAARDYGDEPLGYYARRLFVWAPLWAWPGLGWAVAKQVPRVPLPAWLAGVYFVVISVVPHKEARFVYPALVLLAMAAIPGALGALERLEPKRQSIAAASLVAVSFVPYLFHSELDAQRGDEFRAIVRATREDATGLLLVNENMWGAGGYFFIGREIPWLASNKARGKTFERELVDPKFNRAVTYDDLALAKLEGAGFRVASRIGRATILTR